MNLDEKKFFLKYIARAKQLYERRDAILLKREVEPVAYGTFVEWFGSPAGGRFRTSNDVSHGTLRHTGRKLRHSSSLRTPYRAY